ncbi:MAG: FAD-dependent oxidoreductase [Chloroflexi bacterium]|nr:FAD-dependent oxidoreductase [Chloroflexota bacterium]
MSFRTGDDASILTVRRPGERRRTRPKRTYVEPSREVPVFAETQVLVVGGGPAGCAAAVAAARAGADVLLLERYGYLGGLSTGGLVIWIDRMTDWDGRQVIAGFARDILDRLPDDAVAGAAKATWGSKDPGLNAYWRQRLGSFRDTVTWSPVIDPEWLKLESLRMALELKVTPVFHAWFSTPIVSGSAVQGVVFESKEGRHAIYADVVIDATGDGDVFARAQAAFESDIDEKSMHHSVNVAWMWAGVDMNRWIAFRVEHPEEFNALMERGRQALGEVDRPYVSWRNDVALFLGPRLTGYSAINVEDLTAVEVESRRWMVDLLRFYRSCMPGFSDAWILESAPQIGVRHSRRLSGVQPILRSEWQAGVVYPDEVGVSPSLSPTFPSVSVPYGSLVPVSVDGLLAPGRHMASDASSHTFLREIPQCWLTGQAAGAAAALAARAGVVPRAVDIAALQAELLRQGAYLRAPALRTS